MEAKFLLCKYGFTVEKWVILSWPLVLKSKNKYYRFFFFPQLSYNFRAFLINGKDQKKKSAKQPQINKATLFFSPPWAAFYIWLVKNDMIFQAWKQRPCWLLTAFSSWRLAKLSGLQVSKKGSHARHLMGACAPKRIEAANSNFLFCSALCSPACEFQIIRLSFVSW